jgi:hypothetical protein
MGSSYAFTASADLVASADVTVNANALTPKITDMCAPRDDDFVGCDSTVFRGSTYSGGLESVPGVICDGSVAIPRSLEGGCASLFIPAGTHLRLRKVIEDVHPYTPTYRPIVEVERPCTEACRAGEARCEASQTCFAKGTATCLFCHAADVAVCACQGACSAKNDGSDCSYDTSPDTDQVGTCYGGECRAASR